MKLYVLDHNQRKKYIRIVAKTRHELAHKIGSRRFSIDGISYSVNDVIAESENTDTAAGAILGGLLGLLFSPVGALIGSSIGGLIGNSSESDEDKSVKIFNRSRYEKSKF